MSISTKGLILGMGVQSAMGTAVAATAGLRTRMEAGLWDFKPNMTPIEVPMYDLEWARQDYTEKAGISRPGFPGAPLLLSPGLLQTLLQQVMDEDGPDVGGNYTYTLKATGVNPATDKYLSLIRRNVQASSKDKRLTDAVINTIKLSSSESNQPVVLDADFLATDLVYTYDGSGDTYTLPSENFLLHNGLTQKLGVDAQQCPEYDLTMSFSIAGIVDNNTKPQEFILGEFKVEGTVRWPWADDDALNDFMNSTGNILTWLWGVGDSSGYLEITVPVKYNEPDEDVDNEKRLRQGVPFKLRETSAQDFEIKLQP